MTYSRRVYSLCWRVYALLSIGIIVINREEGHIIGSWGGDDGGVPHGRIVF